VAQLFSLGSKKRFMKTRYQTVVLIIGICLCAVCALFPPRRIILPQDYDHNTLHGQVTHAFVFSEDFGVYRVTRPDGIGLGYLVEVDSGRLLVELVLIASLTGIVVLIPRLKV
jgi:hypothetical protein